MKLHLRSQRQEQPEPQGCVTLLWLSLFSDPSSFNSNAATNLDVEKHPEMSAPIQIRDMRHGNLHQTGAFAVSGSQQQLCREVSIDGLLLLET